MYAVFAVVENEEVCIYDDWSDAQELRLIDPNLELERNSAGTFTFSLPPTNQAYGTYNLTTYRIIGFENNDRTKPIVTEDTREVDLIQRMVTKIVIYRDKTGSRHELRKFQKLWEGRVISEEKDWYNCRAITCEGDLAYLNDTTQPPALYSKIGAAPKEILKQVMKVHNSKVDSSKRFEFDEASTITDDRDGVTDQNRPQYETSYNSTMEIIQELVNEFGGVIRVIYEPVYEGDDADPDSKVLTWKRKIRWDKKLDDGSVQVESDAAPQTIDFGRNLLDFKCNWDLSKLCTVAIPLGAKLENDGTDRIGDPLEVRRVSGIGRYLYLDTDNKIYEVKASDSTLVGGKNVNSYKIKTFNIPDELNDPSGDTVVYVSTRITAGIVAWATSSEPGFNENWDGDQSHWGPDQLSWLVAQPAEGDKYLDLVDQAVTLPHGTKSIAVSGFGEDIQIAVKAQKKEIHTVISETSLTEHENEPYERRIRMKEFSDALSTEPEDWSTTYNNYYTKSGYDYIKNDFEEAPTFVSDTYYAKLQNPTEVETVPNVNYHLQSYNLTGYETNPTKIYISARGGAGDVYFVITDDNWTISEPTQPTRYQKCTTSNKFDEIDALEVTVPAGAKYLYVASYKDGASVSMKWPSATYNRTTEEEKLEATSEKRVTVETATNNTEWHETGSTYVVNKDLVERYGYIERILNFEEISDPDLLCSSAVLYLTKIAYDEMTIELSAVDLRALGYTDVEYINLNQSMHAYSEFHGLDRNFPVTKLSIPLNKPDSMKVTVGETTQNDMSENTNRVNQEIMASLDFQTNTVLQEAKDHATALIAAGGDGFVSLIRDNDDHIKELVVSNTPDPHTSNNVWVFNKNGLGHFDHYPVTDEETKVNAAITYDGHIVADYITTGVLSSILINGCKAVFNASNDNGAGIVIWDENAVGLSGNKKCLEIKRGNISFKNCSAVTMEGESYTIHDADEYARIFGLTEYADKDHPGQYISMMSISARNLALNLDDIWINSSYGGGDAVSGFSSGDDDLFVVKAQPNNTKLNGGPFYLPTTDNPQSSSDYQEVYIKNGYLVIGDSSYDPARDFCETVRFKRGFVI